MRILGIDPGFASLGLAVWEDGKFLEVDAIHTKKSSKAAGLDIFDRAQFIARELEDYMSVDLVLVETLTHPPSSGAATKLGVSHGVIAALVTDQAVELQTALGARRTVTGLAKPTEQRAHQALIHQAPELPGLLEGLPKKSLPHILDAALLVQAWAHSTRGPWND